MEIYIDMGENGSGTRGDQLKVDGLTTCVRVAVVGDYDVNPPQGAKDRFIAHAVEDVGRPEELANLIREVRAAIEKGLRNLRAVVIVSDPESLRLNTDLDAASLDMSVDEQEEQNDKVIGDVEELIGYEPSVVMHSVEEVWELVVHSDKSINYGKARI